MAAYCSTTREALSEIIKKPVLTDKLLQKPPFKFLFDIIMSTEKSTGFMSGLFEPDQMDANNIKDKDKKTEFLQLVISAVEFATQQKIDVKIKSILAGLEPEKTNEFLQLLALAAKSIDRATNETIVSQVKSGEKFSGKSPENLLEYSQKLDPSASGSSAGSNKENRKHKKSDDKNNNETDLVVNGDAKHERSRSKEKSSSKSSKSHKNENSEKSPSKERHRSKDKSPRKKSTSSKSDEKSSKHSKSSHKDKDKDRDKDKEKRSHSKDKNKEKHHKEKELSSKEKDRKSKHSEKSSEKLIDALASGIGVAANLENTQENENELEISATNMGHSLLDDTSTAQQNLSENLELSQNFQESHQNSMADSEKIKMEHQNDPENQGADLDLEAIPRAKTPPNAQSQVQRPATTQTQVQPEESQNPVQTVNIIAPNAATSENDDKNDDDFQFLIDEREQEIMQLDGNEQTVAAEDLNPEEQGGLVRKILETKKELESGLQDENEDRKYVAVVFDEKEREKTKKELNVIQNAIQKLTRTTHPLGRLMDFLQEDLDSMLKELEQWQKEAKINEQRLQQTAASAENSNQNTFLKNRLAELDAQIQQTDAAIKAAEIRIATNNEKISGLMKGMTK